MAVKVQVIFHSLYTHVYQLAEAVAAGAREVSDSEVLLAQVAETLPREILEKMGAVEAKKVFAARREALSQIVPGTPARRPRTKKPVL
jgi:NAD(P)H dehydrogenase (quinone)